MSETTTHVTRATHHIGTNGPQRTNTAAATEAVKLYSAERAVDDPAKLARAARIVRAALARQVLTVADLTGDPEAGDGDA